MTDEDKIDELMTALDEVRGSLIAFFGRTYGVAAKADEFYDFIDKVAKDWLSSLPEITDCEEYRAAHLPELARLARAHNEQLRRTH